VVSLVAGKSGNWTVGSTTSKLVSITTLLYEFGVTDAAKANTAFAAAAAWEAPYAAAPATSPVAAA